MIDFILLGLVIGLIVFIIYSEEKHRQVVNSLLNRIMARNLPEFMASVYVKPQTEPKSLSDYEEYAADCKRKGIEPEKEEF